MTDSTTDTYGSKKFTDDSLTVGDLCTAGDHIYAIIPSKPSVDLPIDLAALCPEFLTQPLFDKTANSKRILISTIETLKKERNERAIEKLGQDNRMEEIMAKVKDMIDESTQSERQVAEKRLKEERAKADAKLASELAKADAKLAKLACDLAKADEKADAKLASELAKADAKLAKLACDLAKADEKLACELEKADEKLACELAKADEKLACELEKADKKLAGELAKANKKIDKLQSNLNSSNDRVDEMSYKLQEVDAMTMDTVEWISLGVRPGSNHHLLELTRTVTGHGLTGSDQAAKFAQHRAGKPRFILPAYRHAYRCFTCLARSIGIHPRFCYQTCHRP